MNAITRDRPTDVRLKYYGEGNNEKKRRLGAQ
jgi:hypothetical protein